MNLVYESDRCQIHLGDCFEILPTLSASDLLVVDPPYGKDYLSNRRTATEAHDKIMGDEGSWDLAALLNLMRKGLRRGRHAYVFGAVELPDDVPFGGSTSLVWDKGITGSGNLASPWGPSHEPILFAVQEISAANRAKGYGVQSARLRKGSVLRVQRRQSSQTNRHPTEKPVELLRILIESSSTLGEMVLDPCMGVGSTLVAAILSGRKAVGIELDAQYLPCAVERVERAEVVADLIERS